MTGAFFMNMDEKVIRAGTATWTATAKGSVSCPAGDCSAWMLASTGTDPSRDSVLLTAFCMSCSAMRL